MKKLKKLSRKEMKSVSGAIIKLTPMGDGECGCICASCVTSTNKDGDCRCRDGQCCS